MFATCLLCEGRRRWWGSGDKDATIAATAGDIKEKLPPAYDMEQAAVLSGAVGAKHEHGAVGAKHEHGRLCQ